MADVPVPELAIALGIAAYIEARVERTLKRVLQLAEETRGRRRLDRTREDVDRPAGAYGRRRPDRRRDPR